MAVSGIHTGWRRDAANSRLDIYYEGTRLGHVDASGLTVAAGGMTVAACGVTVTCGDISTPCSFVSGTIGSANGVLQLNSSGACGGFLRLQSPACASAVYILPSSDGSCGQQLTTSGCNGGLSWAAASLGEFKNDLGVLCRCEALESVRKSPVHKFIYDKAKVPHGYWAPDYEMTGIFGEEAPWAMQGKDRSIFSPINATGYVVAALQSVAEKLDSLTSRVDALEA